MFTEECFVVQCYVHNKKKSDLPHFALVGGPLHVHTGVIPHWYGAGGLDAIAMTVETDTACVLVFQLILPAAMEKTPSCKLQLLLSSPLITLSVASLNSCLVDMLLHQCAI